MLPVPLVRPLDWLEPVQALAALAGLPAPVLLESAAPDPRFGRYSYVAADPFATLTGKDGRLALDRRELTAGDPFAVLQRALRAYPLRALPGLPPFQGGALGYLGYDLCRHLERLPSPRRDAVAFPDLALGFYDLVIAFDHGQRRAHLLASGHPETTPLAMMARARRRADAFAARLATAPPLADPPPPAGEPALASNFTPAAYETAVARVVDYILAGDIFQANLSQRFTATLAPGDDPFALYRRLRAINPAPFAAFLDLPGATIVSASPERFLSLHGRQVETRPIKGTRPRGATPAEDGRLAAELAGSAKDRAENVMIVDLLRNDLSRVCDPGSVLTPEICRLESFATVHHLVSTVTGRLRDDAGAVDLLRATFPGGSITGAPKVRAMEIIAELEPDRRGPYCGLIGWFGFDGSMDTSITIRTIALNGSTATFGAGGGIVADSEPAAEHAETLAKARALIAALRGRQ